MNLAQRVFRNSLWLGGAQVGSRALSFLIVMILTRYLGTREFGTYAFIYAFIGIFGTFTNVGIDTLVLREASKDLKKAETLAGNAILIKVALAVVTVFAAVVVGRLSGLPAFEAGLITLASATFLLSPLSIYGTAFSATLNLHYHALIELAERVLAFLAVVLIWQFRGTLSVLVAALLVTAACQSCLTVYFGRRFFRPALHLDLGLWRTLAREVVPLAISNLLLTLILRIDQIMLARLRPDGDLQLGLYSVAVKYCEILNYLPAIFFASVFPLLSRSGAQGQENFRNLYTASFRYLLLAVMPVALFSTLCAPRIMTLLFGRDFLESARAMQILMWSEPFVFMVWVLVNTSVSAGNQRYLLLPALVAVIANIALNFLLIPGRGAEGAAVASLLSYALVLPLSAWLRPLRALARAFWGAAIRPGLAVLLLWLILRHFQLGLVSAAFAVGCGFVGAMVLAGGLNRDDLALARRALARGP